MIVRRYLCDICLLLCIAPFWLLGWAWEKATGKTLLTYDEEDRP